jgi:hypothetical protein
MHGASESHHTTKGIDSLLCHLAKLIYAYSDRYDQGNSILDLGFSGKNDPLYVIGQVAGGAPHPLHSFPAR